VMNCIRYASLLLAISSFGHLAHAMEQWPNLLSPQLKKVCSATYQQTTNQSELQKNNIQLCEQLRKLLHCHILQENNCSKLYPDIERKHEGTRHNIEKTFYDIFFKNCPQADVQKEITTMKTILNQITKNVDATCFSLGSTPTCLNKYAQELGFPIIPKTRPKN